MNDASNTVPATGPNRTRTYVPQPPAFEVGLGLDINEFFNAFENYCTAVYPGYEEAWSRPLRQYLTGEVLQSYTNIDGAHMKYSELKERLLSVYSRVKPAKQHQLKSFYELSRASGETIINFTLKLEALGRRAGMDLQSTMYRDTATIRILDQLPEKVRSEVNLKICEEEDMTIDKLLDIILKVEKCLSPPTNVTFMTQETKKSPSTSYNIVNITKHEPTAAVEIKNEMMPVDTAAKQLNCTYCRKRNHDFDNCDKRLRRCYKCHSTQHMLPGCPLRGLYDTEARLNNEQIRNSNRRQNESPERKDKNKANDRNLVCPCCGDNHLMIECEIFKAYMTTMKQTKEKAAEPTEGVQKDSAEQDNRLYLPVKIQGYKYRALLDTGAMLTICSNLVAQRHGLKVEPSHVDTLIGVGKQRLKPIGDVKTDVSLPNYGIKNLQLTIVEGLSHPLILGMDFLSKYSLRINFSTETLEYNPQEKKEIYTAAHLVKTPVNITGTPLYLDHTTTLKTNHIHVLTLHLPNSNKEKNLFRTEAIETHPNLFMSSTINAGSIAHVKIMNLGDEPVKLKKGVPIAYAKELHEIKGTLYEDDWLEEQEENDKPNLETKEATLEEILEKFHLEETDLRKDQKQNVRNLLLEFNDVISRHEHDVGKIPDLKHHIRLKDYCPIKVKARRFPPQVQAKINEEVKRLEEQGIIEPSCSEYSFPVVPVVKPSGNLRLCVDYRLLNRITVKDSYPLPNLVDSVYGLHGNSYFSHLDLTMGYFHVEVDEESRKYTAFSAGTSSLYQYVKLPFGLSSSPAVFMRAIHMAMSGLTFQQMIAYLDDILVIGQNFEEHLQNLRLVFERLRQHGLKIKPDKCHLCKHEVEFLGCKVTPEGLLPLQKNVQTIMDFKAPRTVLQLQRFLGSVNFYRRHIPDCAKHMKPLTDLLKGKSKSLAWTEETQQAFDVLKSAFISPILLSFPDYQSVKPLEIHVDASGYGVGAVLKQEQEGVKKCIAYASTSFNEAQLKYSTLERELAGIRYAVKTFRPFVVMTKFQIATDHSPICYLHQTANVNHRIARTLAELSEYDFEFVYVPGKYHHLSDLLSRIPEPPENLSSEEMEERINFIPPGYEVKLMPGGGDAFFKAVSQFLFGDYDRHLYLRKTAVEEVATHPERYNLKMDKTTRGLLKRVDLPGTLPIAEVILATSHCQTIDINVYEGEGPPVCYKSPNATRTCNIISRQSVHFDLLLPEEKLEHKEKGIVKEANLLDMDFIMPVRKETKKYKEEVLYHLDTRDQYNHLQHSENMYARSIYLVQNASHRLQKQLYPIAIENTDQYEVSISENSVISLSEDGEENTQPKANKEMDLTIAKQQEPMKYTRNHRELKHAIEERQSKSRLIDRLYQILSSEGSIEDKIAHMKSNPHLKRYAKYTSDFRIVGGHAYKVNAGGINIPLISYQNLLELIIDTHQKFAHIGREKMFYKLKNVAFHPGINSAIADCLRCCEKCQLFKRAPARRQRGPMWKTAAKEPFERVDIDLLEMIPTTAGNKYILAAVDVYSKWLSATAIPNKQAETVITALETRILPTMLRIPDVIQSDGGREMDNELMRRFCSRNTIKHRFSAAYQPETNGGIERLNETLLGLLKMASPDSEEWDRKLPNIVRIYNNTFHTSIGKTPEQVFLENTNVKQREKTWRKSTDNYQPYKVGELVLRKVIKPGFLTAHKLSKNYYGPLKISRVYDNLVLYDLEDLKTGKIWYRIHANQLKFWNEPEENIRKVMKKMEDRNNHDQNPDCSEFVEPYDFSGFGTRIHDFSGFQPPHPESIFKLNFDIPIPLEHCNWKKYPPPTGNIISRESEKLNNNVANEPREPTSERVPPDPNRVNKASTPIEGARQLDPVSLTFSSIVGDPNFLGFSNVPDLSQLDSISDYIIEPPVPFRITLEEEQIDSVSEAPAGVATPMQIEASLLNSGQSNPATTSNITAPESFQLEQLQQEGIGLSIQQSRSNAVGADSLVDPLLITLSSEMNHLVALTDRASTMDSVSQTIENMLAPILYRPYPSSGSEVGSTVLSEVTQPSPSEINPPNLIFESLPSFRNLTEANARVRVSEDRTILTSPSVILGHELPPVNRRPNISNQLAQFRNEYIQDNVTLSSGPEEALEALADFNRVCTRIQSLFGLQTTIGEVIIPTETELSRSGDKNITAPTLD